MCLSNPSINLTAEEYDIKHNYYTLKETSLRIDISGVNIRRLLDKYPALLGCIEHKNELFFRRKDVDGMTHFADGKKVKDTKILKRLLIIYALEQFMYDSAKNAPVAYTITISLLTENDITKTHSIERKRRALNRKAYRYDPIEVQINLKKTFKMISRRIYGRNWNRDGNSIELTLIAEGLHSDLHFHGYILLPEDIRNKKVTDQRKYVQDLVREYISGSNIKDINVQDIIEEYVSTGDIKGNVKVNKTHIKGTFKRASIRMDDIQEILKWEKYCVKQLKSIANLRTDESFDETMKRLIIV